MKGQVTTCPYREHLPSFIYFMNVTGLGVKLLHFFNNLFRHINTPHGFSIHEI